MEGLVSSPEGIGAFSTIVRQYANYHAWALNADDLQSDLILIECPTLFVETVRRIEELTASSSAARSVVVYNFAQTAALKLAAQKTKTITLMRAQVTAAELKTACEADLALSMIRSLTLEFPSDSEDSGEIRDTQPSEEIPTRLFDDIQLSKISNISTSIECECPHHMASVLAELNAFEKYSQECENKNPEDETLHHLLHLRTAQARSMMEDALAILIAAEGIDIPSSAEH